MGHPLNADAGVVEHHIEPSISVNGLCYEVFHFLFTGYLHFDESPITISAQFFLRFFSAFFIVITDDHFGAFIQECSGRGKPDSRGAARYYSHFVFKIQSELLLSIFHMIFYTLFTAYKCLYICFSWQNSPGMKEELRRIIRTGALPDK